MQAQLTVYFDVLQRPAAGYVALHGLALILKMLREWSNPAMARNRTEIWTGLNSALVKLRDNPGLSVTELATGQKCLLI